MDGSPLTRKFANGRQMAIQGQGCFIKCGLPRVISPVVYKGYKEIDELQLPP